MEQLVILLLIALISLINWLVKKSSELREARKREQGSAKTGGSLRSEPPQLPEAEPDISMRRLREALGLPEETEPPVLPKRMERPIPPPLAPPPLPPPRPPAGRACPSRPRRPRPRSRSRQSSRSCDATGSWKCWGVVAKARPSTCSSYDPHEQVDTLERASDLGKLGGRYWV